MEITNVTKASLEGRFSCNMKLIVQQNLLKNHTLDLINQAIIKNDIPHEYVSIIPFTGEIVSNYPLVGVDYLPYGSTLFTMETHQLGWKGQYFNPSTFRADVWYENRDDMLNAGGQVLAVSEAINFLKTVDSQSLWFIRPTEDIKTFSGQIIEASECVDWLTDAMECVSSGSYKLDPTTQIVLAEPQKIGAEWRWFIVGGTVVDGSMYRLAGRLHNKHEVDPTVIEEAQKLANKWLPSPCCVMDLALVDDTIKVIEFNTINSSGFYDHDVEKIIVALYNYTAQNNTPVGI